MPQHAETPPIQIKRYARSRLYHVAEGRYVSHEELRSWVEQGVAFVVIDAETERDVTDLLFT